jgi:hypothetical protein
MECRICGRWAAADSETGYDADDVCPDCEAPQCWWCAGELPRDEQGGYCSSLCEASAQADSEAVAS